MHELSDSTGFQWDEGNADKNWEKHRVARLECEQPFFNEPFLVNEDDQHSNKESMYFALGHTNQGRYLFINFTLRDDLIRVTSARPMNRTERRYYDDVKNE
jgi:hypothetical protein